MHTAFNLVPEEEASKYYVLKEASTLEDFSRQAEKIAMTASRHQKPKGESRIRALGTSNNHSEPEATDLPDEMLYWIDKQG